MGRIPGIPFEVSAATSTIVLVIVLDLLLLLLVLLDLLGLLGLLPLLKYQNKDMNGFERCAGVMFSAFHFSSSTPW